jgi:hypothetical protein
VDLDGVDLAVPLQLSDLSNPLDQDRTGKIKRGGAHRLNLGFRRGFRRGVQRSISGDAPACFRGRGEVDEARRVEGSSCAWSAGSIASCDRAEARLEVCGAQVSFGHSLLCLLLCNIDQKKNMT